MILMLAQKMPFVIRSEGKNVVAFLAPRQEDHEKKFPSEIRNLTKNKCSLEVQRFEAFRNN